MAEETKTAEDAERKKEEFSEWYNEVIEKSGLTDKRYPVKGMNIWRPYGWGVMSRIDDLIREEMRRTRHQEVRFPLLIPDEEFEKEADHIKGFGDEVFWVTKAGDKELDIPLLLRPTSETAMYPVFDLWLRSHADLPLKIYQMVNVFRYETKQTRAFMRMREIYFFEAHTCHSTGEKAEEQIREDLRIMEKFAEELALPYLELKRTDWDKFPGADYTVGVDALMPTGRLLQIAGIHQYKSNFSEAFDITFEDEDGNHKNVHQTTYGMSERLVGAVVGVHGDDKGLVLPPAIAPEQVRIIPIVYGDEEKIMEYCEEIERELREDGYRVEIDERDERPGSKFYDSEMKGIPIRLDIGSDEVEDEVVTVVRRDTGEKEQVSVDELKGHIGKTFESMKEDMYRRAEEHLQSNIVDVESLDEITEEKVYRLGWCGKEDCGEEIEEITGRKLLGTRYGGEEFSGECVHCGDKTDKAAYLCNAH